MYGINLVLQFFSRKIFLDYLGTEILGLNTTATNLLQFLNLAELGIGAAIGFTLYKPVYNNDKDSIIEILTIQKWYYRRIAYLVICGSAILMCFFPWIFSKTDLPLWYAYASYSVILLSALLGYFFNYKQVLLSADQKDYKIQYSYKLVMLIKIAAQTLAVKYFSHPYIYWLILEALFAIAASINLSQTIKKTYPYITNSLIPIKELKAKHSILVTKIGQVFYHKIGGFALTQSSPLIIYAYANLTLVTIYGNYQIIVLAITSLMAAVFNSMNGGIGNLVASNDKIRIISVFKELFSVRFLFISTFCVAFYILSASIIYYWIGNAYLLPNTTVILIIANMFIILNRSTVDNYISAYGLYGDIYSPLAEAILNIGLSVLFGYYWGLNGILLGVFSSLFLVIFCWKPFYLFKKGLKENFKKYLYCLLKNTSAAFFSLLIVLVIAGQLRFQNAQTLKDFIEYMSYVFLYFISCAFFLYLFKSGFTYFIFRLKKWI